MPNKWIKVFVGMQLTLAATAIIAGLAGLHIRKVLANRDHLQAEVKTSAHTISQLQTKLQEIEKERNDVNVQLASERNQKLPLPDKTVTQKGRDAQEAYYLWADEQLSKREDEVDKRQGELERSIARENAREREFRDQMMAQQGPPAAAPNVDSLIPGAPRKQPRGQAFCQTPKYLCQMTTVEVSPGSSCYCLGPDGGSDFGIVVFNDSKLESTPVPK